MKKIEALKTTLPKNIVRECWAGFVEMRYSIKKPLTERSIKLIFIKLDRLDKALANEILDQSTMNCWQGVFKLREDWED